MPYLAVIVPTTRVGGLDVLADGLKRQTFKDFQLILSDGIYQHRKDLVAEKFKQQGVNCKHIEPFNNPFFTLAYSRYVNSALAHADAEMVLIISDYTLLDPQTLERHATFHMRNPTIGLMSPHQYNLLPKLSEKFKPYTPDQTDTEKYVEDIKSGKLKDMMWSIFKDDYSVDKTPLVTDPKMGNLDAKLRFEKGEVAGAFFHCKNESFGLANILKCNGFHEGFDGTNCYQDTDAGEKLLAHGGLTKWHNDPSNVVYILNPRHIFPFPKRLRTIEDNFRILTERRNTNFPRSNNWDLQETNHTIKRKVYYETKLNNTNFTNNFDH